MVDRINLVVATPLYVQFDWRFLALSDSMLIATLSYCNKRLTVWMTHHLNRCH